MKNTLQSQNNHLVTYTEVPSVINVMTDLVTWGHVRYIGMQFTYLQNLNPASRVLHFHKGY